MTLKTSQNGPASAGSLHLNKHSRFRETVFLSRLRNLAGEVRHAKAGTCSKNRQINSSFLPADMLALIR
jgi:hypothetical protein